MTNYENRTIEPIVAAAVDEIRRKFLTEDDRANRESVMYFRDPFKLTPVSAVAEMADKFTRNEIMTSNEFRQALAKGGYGHHQAIIYGNHVKELQELGEIVDYVSGRNRYVGYLISLAAHSYKNMRVGLDCANGSAWNIAKTVFEALGAKTFVINAEPDGVNINRGAGSTHIDGCGGLSWKPPGRRFCLRRRRGSLSGGG